MFRPYVLKALLIGQVAWLPHREVDVQHMVDWNRLVRGIHGGGVFRLGNFLCFFQCSNMPHLPLLSPLHYRILHTVSYDYTVSTVKDRVIRQKRMVKLVQSDPIH